MLLVGCMFFVSLSCEDLDLDNDEAGSVQGLWELFQTPGSNTYLLISDREVIFYYYDARDNCITVDAYEVVRIDGTGFYILDQEGLEENRVLAISKNGDRIHVRDLEETQSELDKFFPSNVDVNTLAPVCPDPTDVFGNWELELEDGNKVYLSIREDSVKVFDHIQDQACYFVSEMEVLEINGNVFTITDNDPSSPTGIQEVTLIRTPEGLEIERLENGTLITELYLESNADFSTFTPECKQFSIEDIMGVWELTPQRDQELLYLDISESKITYYTLKSGENCYGKNSHGIVSFEDGILELSNGGDALFYYQIVLEDGRLTTIFEDSSNSESFVRTNFSSSDFSNLCSNDLLQEIGGKWQYNASVEEEDVEFYLIITNDSFTFHFRIGDPINDPDNVCFEIQEFPVISFNNDSIIILDDSIEPPSQIELFVNFRTEEGLLYVDDKQDILTFFPSNIDDGYINNACPDVVVPSLNRIF